MATDKLINSTQGDDIIEALSSIADNIENVPSSYEFSSAQVVSMVGYEKASGAAAISQADTLNEAAGKLEYKVDANNANIQSILDGTTIDSFGDVETALADKADNDNVYRLALSNADLLPANTDLDNLKTVGCYYVLAAVTVPTITHRPTENGSAFRVTVEMAAGTIRPRQIYQEYNSYDTYIRAENSSEVWGGWKKVEGDLSTIYTKTEVDTALAGKQATLTTEQLSAVNSGIDSTKVGQIATNQSDISSLAANTVPKTRTINGNALSSDITLTASDVGAIATTAKGANGGVAELDSNGKVPSSQLPSYVDDVLEYSSTSAFPATGETGKIYVDTTTNKTYRWGGSTYVEISASLALGDTSSTAYYGDKGKTAYEHSQLTSGNPHNVTASDVGLGSVGNFKAVSTVASQGLSDTEKSNARANIGAGTSSLTLGTSSTQAATGNHTHGLSMAADSGTSSISLAANTKYKLTAGGSTYVFTTPPDNNTTYGVVSTSANGLAPKVTDTSKFLKGDGTWATPTNTWTAMVGATSSANGSVGYVNATPPKDGYNTKYLRADGSWQVPPNTTYSAATTSAAGLMSATDKSKLDGIATGAQVNSITGVKGNAESTYRTGNVNLTPANIGAAASSHTHNYAGSSSAGGAATSANKLNTDKGSATQPVYFSGGVPVATTYSLAKSVPSDAKFTDTVYTHPTSAGNKHIPSGGSSGQVLVYGGSSGTASWSSDYMGASLAPATFATLATGINYFRSALVKQGKHISGWVEVDTGTSSYYGTLITINTTYRPASTIYVYLESNGRSILEVGTNGVVDTGMSGATYLAVIHFDYVIK